MSEPSKNNDDLLVLHSDTVSLDPSVDQPSMAPPAILSPSLWQSKPIERSLTRQTTHMSMMAQIARAKIKVQLNLANRMNVSPKVTKLHNNRRNTAVYIVQPRTCIRTTWPGTWRTSITKNISKNKRKPERMKNSDLTVVIYAIEDSRKNRPSMITEDWSIPDSRYWMPR